MPLKQFTIDFRELKIDPNIRLWLPFRLPEIKYQYDKLINYLSVYESGSRPKGGINSEEEEEAISLGGEQINTDGSVDLSKIPYVSYEFYEKADKGKVKDLDILICKDGALTGKTCLVDFNIFSSKEVMINEHVYVLRGNEKINQKFLFYLTTSRLIQSQIKNLAYRKKAQPGLNSDHLKRIKIPLIPKPTQDQIVARIEPIEKKIKEIKNKITPPQEVINKVFSREFRFDIQKVYSVEQKRYFLVSDTLPYRNSRIRSSVRWHKIAPIQDFLYKNNPYIKKLGKYIISTKNGWSPSCRESDSSNFVFSVNSISVVSVINYDDLKVSDETRKDIKDYFSKEGDLFVSRGNTVDLVALASVVKNMPGEKDIIFPDLFIRIDVNEKELNKGYLAYLFNSIIGRLYFKYAAKGKNQTMVKISSDELNNFYLPIPPLKNQQKIVDEIKVELDKQEEMKQKIDMERNKIDEIIEKAIKNS